VKYPFKYPLRSVPSVRTVKKIVPVQIGRVSKLVWVTKHCMPGVNRKDYCCHAR